jgi:hypothetical protein
VSRPGETGGVRLVVLDDVCAGAEDRAATGLFGRMVRMRASGYAGFYGARAMPFDRSDFIATHVLLCTDEGGALEPQGGFKKVSLERSDAYGVEFPIVPWVRAPGADRHALAVAALVDEHRRSGRRLTYNGSLVLARGARPRTVPRLLREVVAALAFEHHLETGGAEITVAVLRTGTDDWFPEVGFEPMHWEGEPLRPVAHYAAPGDRIVPMVLEEPGPWTRECYEKHARLLEERVRLGGPA